MDKIYYRIRWWWLAWRRLRRWICSKWGHRIEERSLPDESVEQYCTRCGYTNRLSAADVKIRNVLDEMLPLVYKQVVDSPPLSKIKGFDHTPVT